MIILVIFGVIFPYDGEDSFEVILDFAFLVGIYLGLGG